MNTKKGYMTRLEEAEERVTLSSGDWHELELCGKARKHLENGNVDEADAILRALEAPVAKSYNGDDNFRPDEYFFVRSK